ncbi:MAG: M50 family metallopeptidase [Oscillospiraceae bacterium]|nr:M50 family metallopeptidase [Oscillospiraceae bacterium]
MRLRFGRVSASGGFVVMAALVYLFDTRGFVPLLILVALVHELGHFVAIWALGGQVLRLDRGLVGLRTDYEGRRVGYPGEIGIALMGPAANLALAYGASLLGRHTGSETAFFLAGISLGASVFNLLPIYQLDGGRALYCFMAWAVDADWGGRVICVISCVLIFLLLLAGLLLFYWSTWNFTLLTAAIWLFISYCKSEGSAVKYAVAEY